MKYFPLLYPLKVLKKWMYLKWNYLSQYFKRHKICNILDSIMTYMMKCIYLSLKTKCECHTIFPSLFTIYGDTHVNFRLLWFLRKRVVSNFTKPNIYLYRRYVRLYGYQKLSLTTGWIIMVSMYIDEYLLKVKESFVKFICFL